MNKKGITVVELVVTFSLTITVAIFLIQIILTVSKIYTKNGIKTEMLNKKSIISNEINTKFRNSAIDSIEVCGDDCYVFKYTDTTSSTLKIENDLLTFGDFATKFSSSGINLDLIYGPTVQNYLNDSIFKLTISGDYPINIIYQFDKDTSRIDEFFTDNEEVKPEEPIKVTKVYAVIYSDGTDTVLALNSNGNVDSNKTILMDAIEINSNGYIRQTDRPYNNYKDSITKIVIEDIIVPTSTSYWFSGFSNLTNIENISNLNTSNMINMYAMFEGCSNLTNLDLSSFNTSKVRTMSWMFSDCTNLISLNLSSFDTSNVTNMSHLFDGCNNLTNLDLSSFDTSNVTNMKYMFIDASNLQKITVSNKWNIKEGADTTDMFTNCGVSEVTYE